MKVSRRVLCLVCFLFAAMGIAHTVAAQGPAIGGLLADLPTLKDFTAARQSSFDPSGGNADGRQDWPIAPGETRQMAKIDGAGAITHIWVTIASDDPNHLRNLVLRMYWDGEETPSVEAPIGDFFGLGYSTYYQYSCYAIQIGTNNGLNCFWHMPFSRGATVTVTNDGPVKCAAFYYYVDYQQYATPPKDMGRFHAQYRQEYPCTPGKNYTFMEAIGRGHYVGVNLSIHNRADGWWGEGDDMIYIDGEEKPTFNGTGSEDYFCGAWCYGPTFSNLFLGCPMRGEHKRNDYWNVYRHHLTDPIPFTKSIRVTIEHGHANDRSDDFSSVAYWYQTEPHATFPALPAAADRLPAETTVFKEEGVAEGEDLVPTLNSPDARLQVMGGYADKWSNDDQLWFTPTAPKTYTFPMTIPATDAGNKKLELWVTKAPDYGTCEIWANGEKVTQWDGFDANGVSRAKVDGAMTLKEGENTVELRITGKNADSAGFFAGIDCYRITAK